MGLPMFRTFCICISKYLSDVRSRGGGLCAQYVVSVNVGLVEEVVS
jgi:hypothetical protein